jgi:phage terminase small subunit
MTEKQKLFCKEYIIDFNATKAAERAGYSKDTAKQIGHENLTKLDLQVEINKEIDKRTERVVVKQDRVIYELAKMAFADLSNYLKIDTTGVSINPDIENFDMSVLSEASETVTKDGGTIRIKLADKLKALELLGKHLAMFTDRQEHSGFDDSPIKIEFVKPKK